VINYDYLKTILKDAMYLALHRVKNGDPNLNYATCSSCRVIYEVKLNCAESVESSELSTQNHEKICDTCLEIEESKKEIPNDSVRCPGCLLYINKLNGCNHITHKIGDFKDSSKINCECHFCYSCGGVKKKYPFRSQ